MFDTYDITFCGDKKCRKSKKCHRFMGNHKNAFKKVLRVSFTETFKEDGKKKCDYFMPIKKEKKK